MHRVHGVVQHYAWGDPTTIPAMLGRASDGRPWAELWLGTHDGGASTVETGDFLRDVAGELPYLLKVLAASAALSLQTHPTTADASAGFAREEASGVAIDAPERIYRDPRAKPELICALTPFDALCGFRPVAPTIDLLRRLGADDLAHALGTGGLRATVASLYRRTLDPAPTIAACVASSGREAALVAQLARQYPGDPSAVVTLLLHRVLLQPGEAIFLGPGNLHAYLRGVGVEIMGASDNVVRGGLTVKHVDVDELLRVLDIDPLPDPVLRPQHHASGWDSFDTPGTPFRLWRRELHDGQPVHHTSSGRELLLCVAGDVGVIRRGETVFLPEGDVITLAGAGLVFCVEERLSG